MAEYAKVEAGVVTMVIVAEQDHIDTRSDGPWVLTPAKVGIGYKGEGALFLAPLPSAISLAVGAPLSLAATVATGGTPTYQWKKDASDIVGETAATLEIATVAGGDAGSYTCVVDDGTDTATTSACVVTVS